MPNAESILRCVRPLLGSAPFSSSSLVSRLTTFFLEVGTLGRGLRRRINGEPEIRLVPEMRFLGSEYEPEVSAWMKAKIRPGDVVLDVGTQVGLYAVFASRWVGSSGKIVAFDPSPHAVKLMRRHLRLNRCSDRVAVVQAAVSFQEGEVSMPVAGADPENSLASAACSSGTAEMVKVPTVRLDLYCARNDLRPNLIKIDTEGWELHILRGAGSLLEDDGITWVVEMHPYAWAYAGYSRVDVEAFLRQHRLEVVPLTGQADPLAVYGDTYLRRTPCS